MASKAKDGSKADVQRLRRWQVNSPSGKPWPLSKVDAAARPCSTGDKARDKREVLRLAHEIDTLQDLLFADRRYRVLVVLQGMDASGKDGTIRGVFGEVSPLGVRTTSWRAPTPQERDHDFLWRIHQHTPGAGDLMIFNRSHYEDVLVPVANGQLTTAQTLERYAHINDFERMLSQTGTVILKFMLHISKDEQRKRLQARLDDPDKHWKFEGGDLETRKKWDVYQQAYADAIAATGTEWAPWTIVPADSKTHRNLMVATAVKRRLEALKLRYPPGDPALNQLKVE
jgi:PPK2 family polyphosphate:nucleotide phosphotransferase